MGLLDLPPEIFARVVEWSILANGALEAKRMRLISRVFNHQVMYSFFRVPLSDLIPSQNPQNICLAEAVDSKSLGRGSGKTHNILKSRPGTVFTTAYAYGRCVREKRDGSTAWASDRWEKSWIVPFTAKLLSLYPELKDQEDDIIYFLCKYQWYADAYCIKIHCGPNSCYDWDTCMPSYALIRSYDQENSFLEPAQGPKGCFRVEDWHPPFLKEHMLVFAASYGLRHIVTQLIADGVEPRPTFMGNPFSGAVKFRHDKILNDLVLRFRFFDQSDSPVGITRMIRYAVNVALAANNSSSAWVLLRSTWSKMYLRRCNYLKRDLPIIGRGHLQSLIGHAALGGSKKLLSSIIHWFNLDQRVDAVDLADTIINWACRGTNAEALHFGIDLLKSRAVRPWYAVNYSCEKYEETQGPAGLTRYYNRVSAFPGSHMNGYFEMYCHIVATLWNSLDCLTILIAASRPRRPDVLYRTVLQSGVIKGDIEQIEFAFEHGPKPLVDSHFATNLVEMCTKSEKINVVWFLLNVWAPEGLIDETRADYLHDWAHRNRSVSIAEAFETHRLGSKAILGLVESGLSDMQDVFS